VKRVAALVCLWLLPAVAHAQVTGAAADAGGDIEALQAQLDRDYAQALAGDCSLACRALDSMRRSADRLCQLDPGERCSRAKEKVDTASARVRASCPTCAEQLGGKAEKGYAPPAPPPKEPGPAPPTETVVENEALAAPAQRGCGCTTTRSPGDAIEAMALGGLVLVALRRRKRS
jgi:MYXO-CTERM domain-containing protein